jgi:hypothetical protein
VSRDWTSGLPTRLELASGEELRLELPSGLGGAYRWSAAVTAGADLIEARVERGPVPDPGIPPSNATAPEFLVLARHGSGPARFRLDVARFGQEATPAASHEVLVEG